MHDFNMRSSSMTSDHPEYDVPINQEIIDRNNMDYVASELGYCYSLLFNDAERPEDIRMENLKYGSIMMVTQTENTGTEDERLANRIVFMGGNMEYCWRELGQFFRNNPEAYKRLLHWMETLQKQQPASYIQHQ